MTNYPCPNCERVFSRRSSLRNHVKTHENIVDRVLREISEDTRQEDAASDGEQQFGQEENPVFGDEQRGDEQREEEEEKEQEEQQEQEFEEEEEQEFEEEEEQEFEEEQQEFEEEQQEFEEEEQEFEEENPEEEEGSSSHSPLSLDSEEQEEVEDAVIISYLIYTAIAMYIDKIDKLYVDKLINYLCTH